MEKVQITGGGNGVYTDTKGRRLYTMGDYSPAVGAWVWTNGTTIYGHQSGSVQPAAPIDGSILPIILREYDQNTGYGNKCLCQLLPSAGIRKIENVNIDAINYINDSSHAYLQTNSEDWYNIITGEHLGRFSVSQVAIADNGDLISLWYEDGYYHNDGHPVNYNLTPLYDRTIFRGTDSVGRSFANWQAYSAEITRNDPYIEFRRNGKIIQKINFAPIFSAAIKKVQMITENLHEMGDDRGEDAITSPYYARPKYYVVGTVDVSGNPGLLTPDGRYRARVLISVNGNAYPWVTVKGAAGKAVRYWIDNLDYSYMSTYTVENGTIQLTLERASSHMQGYGYPAPPIKKSDYEKYKKDKTFFSFKPFKNKDFAAIRWVDDVYPFEDNDGIVYYNSYYVFGDGWNYRPPRPNFTVGRLDSTYDRQLTEAWDSAGLVTSETDVWWGNSPSYTNFDLGNGFYYEIVQNDTMYFKDRTGNTIFVLDVFSDEFVLYFRGGRGVLRICKSGSGYWFYTESYLLYILNRKIVFSTGGYNYNTNTMDNYLLTTTFWSLTPFKRKRKLIKSMQKLARIINGKSN